MKQITLAFVGVICGFLLQTFPHWPNWLWLVIGLTVGVFSCSFRSAYDSVTSQD